MREFYPKQTTTLSQYPAHATDAHHKNYLKITNFQAANCFWVFTVEVQSTWGFTSTSSCLSEYFLRTGPSPCGHVCEKLQTVRPTYIHSFIYFFIQSFIQSRICTLYDGFHSARTKFLHMYLPMCLVCSFFQSVVSYTPSYTTHPSFFGSPVPSCSSSHSGTLHANLFPEKLFTHPDRHCRFSPNFIFVLINITSRNNKLQTLNFN